MSEWQPIKTAPYNVAILVFGKWSGEVADLSDDPPCAGVARQIWPGMSWYAEIADTYSVTCEPTHWMPLPPPPEGKT